MLTPADVAMHAQLGIDAEILEQMQVRRIDDREARDVLGLMKRPGRLDGVLYPYLLPGQLRPVTHRLRRDHPDLENGKPKNKYLSAYGDRKHLYFATTDPTLLTDVTVPVVLVEAEKSVLAVTCVARRTDRRMLVLGLGGCWGWRGRIGKVIDARGASVDEVGPLPDLDRVTWSGREAILIFDANAATRTPVQAARRALGLDLSRRGAHVRIVPLPVEDGLNGCDDYIGRHGDQSFIALFEAAADARSFDAIFRLNMRHFVVPESGKTVVISDEYDPVLSRQVLQRSTFADFRNLYLNEYIETTHPKTGKPIWKPLGHVWLGHPDRRQYEGIIMRPAGDWPDYFNLWRGFAVTPQAGTWARFHDHLQQVICAGDARHFAYLLAWLASGVQHPERQAEVAIALRGPRGGGKGFFARTYGELFGQHYLQIANTKHLTGNFNAHLQDTVVLFADEAFWAGDKAGESVLKMLVTEPVIPIERKGRDLIQVPNLLHIIIASNHDWVVPAGMDERRFFVLDIDPARRQDHDYFAAIQNELNAGGRAAFLHDLLHHDLSGVNLRDVPATEALRQQKVLSLPPNERWLFDKLMAGRSLPTHETWETIVLKDALHDDYILSSRRVGVDRRSTQTELGMFLSKIFPGVETVQRLIDGKRRWCWRLHDLATCRAAFDAATHSSHPWSRDDDGN